jgi:hypothetical protein
LDLDSQTELLCFGLIMAETLGAPDRRRAAEIEDDRFVSCANASRPWVSSALKKLAANGMIEISHDRHEYAPVRGGGYSDIPKLGGRATYALADEYVRESRNAGKEQPKGRCPHCKVVGTFETRFVPTPHQALRRLGSCVDPATFKVTMAILSRTLEWNRADKCVDVVPREMEKQEIARMTGLEDRQITEGISRGVKLGLIGREIRAGRPSLFWVNPERFSTLEKREPRTVDQPASHKSKANKEAAETAKTPVKAENTPAVESNRKFYGRCNACGYFGDVEPVSDAEFADANPAKAAAEPKQPPRAGPARETGRKDGRKLTKTEQIIRKLQEKYARKA